MVNFLVLFVLIPGALLCANPVIQNLPANTWYEVPNSKMSAVTPAEGQFAGTWGIVGPASVIVAWGGGAYDTKRDRLILWGGGHADYYGNELYAFDVKTLTWERITDPFVNPVLGQEVNADGTPNSRHTYGGLAYIEHADRFFGIGGSLAGSGFDPCWRTWTFNFDTELWTNRSPSTNPVVGYDCYAAYDPESKKIWWQGGGSWGGLWDYDYDSNTWAKHNDDNFPSLGNAVDTKRGLLFSIGAGGEATGGVCVYDIRGGNYTRQVWTTTGGDAFVSKKAVGLAYDPKSDRIVGWHGGGVYALNPDTKAWDVYNPSGEPTPPGQGTYGRWRYIPSVNAFITVTGINDNVHFYKLTAGATGSEKAVETRRSGTLTAEPNPFRTSTRITFDNGLENGAVFQVYSLQGALVSCRFVTAAQVSGGLRFEAGHAPAGVYAARLTTGGRSFECKMLLMK